MTVTHRTPPTPSDGPGSRDALAGSQAACAGSRGRSGENKGF
jgi:hypothetical protein